MVSSAWEKVGSKCISSSFAKGGFPKNRGDEFESEGRENEISNKFTSSFLAQIEITMNLVCDSNGMTSEIPTLSDLLNPESDSLDNDEDDDDEELKNIQYQSHNFLYFSRSLCL